MDLTQAIPDARGRRRDSEGQASSSPWPTRLIWLWLLILVLHYPVLVLIPAGLLSGRTDWVLFPYSSVALLSLAILLLGCWRNRWDHGLPLHPVALGAAAVLLLLNAAHFLRDDRQGLEHLAFALIWLALPLAAWVNGRRLTAALPTLAMLLWLLNCLHGAWQWASGMEVVGLPGNRNWHGALLLAITPLAMLCLRDWLPGGDQILRRCYRWTALLGMGTLSLLLLYQAHSRAAWLSLAVIVAAVAWMHLPSWRKWLIAIAGAAMIAIAMLCLTKGTQVAELIARDVRPPLWQAAIELIATHPAIGVSHAGFENAFHAELPVAYFLRGHATFRSNHPHNQILYLAGCLGLIGLLAWLCLWTWPLWWFFRNYAQLTTSVQIVGWCFLTLLIHSCLDLVLFEWPTLDLAGLCLGVLWFQLAPGRTAVATLAPVATPPEKSLRQRRSAAAWAALALAMIMFGLFIHETIIQAQLSYWRQFTARQLAQAHPARAAYGCAREVELRDSAHPRFILAKLMLEQFSDPAQAMAQLQHLDHLPDQDYSYSNHLRGLALTAMRHPHLALPYLRRDAELSPISIVSLYSLWQGETRLGLDAAAMATLAKLDWALRLKGLTPADLPAILADPDLDLKFYRHQPITPVTEPSATLVPP